MGRTRLGDWCDFPVGLGIRIAFLTWFKQAFTDPERGTGYAHIELTTQGAEGVCIT